MKNFFAALPAPGRLLGVWLLMACAILTGCAKDIPLFTPPDQRPLAAVERPWSDGLLTLAYHDVEDTNPDQSFLSVRTDHLVEQLTWLRLNGYQPLPGACELLALLRQRGIPCVGFTNGSTKTPQKLSEALTAIGMDHFSATPGPAALTALLATPQGPRVLSSTF